MTKIYKASRLYYMRLWMGSVWLELKDTLLDVTVLV